MPFNNYPYTNLNDLNLDRVLKLAEEARNLNQDVYAYIREHLDEVAVEAMYRESDNALVLGTEQENPETGGTIARVELAGKIHDLKIPTRNRYVFMGDSWATGYIDGTQEATPWPQHVKQCLEIDDGDFFVIAENGCAFNPNHSPNFDALLAANYSSVTDRDTITHVIVGAGLNDTYDYSFNNITQGITNFANRAKQLFPNAKIYLFALGWSQFGSRKGILQSVYSTYARACPRQNITFVNGGQYITIPGTFFPASNGSHINDEGQIQCGRFIANYLAGGTLENNSYAAENCTLTPVNGATVSNFVACQVRNGKKYIKFGNVNVNFETAVTINAWNSFDIGYITANLINGVNTPEYVIPATVRIKAGDDYETRPCGIVFLQDTQDWHKVNVRMYTYGSSGTGSEIFGNVKQIKLSTTSTGDINPYLI